MKKHITLNNTWLKTSNSIVICLFLYLFLAAPVQPQPLQEPQDQAARTFMTALFDKNYSLARNLLDPDAQKIITLENLQEAAKTLDELATHFGKELIPFMRGFRTYQNGQTVIIYTYKFRSDVSKGIASALLDVAFKDASTTAILGFAPKFATLPNPNPNQISTSSGEEITVEKEQEWLVGDQKINVNELALVLDQNQALFAIKVMDDSARTITKERAREKAIPIIKYALAHGCLQKAELGASQAKRKLSEGIGVAFIQPGTRGGYRIIIPPGDYKN